LRVDFDFVLVVFFVVLAACGGVVDAVVLDEATDGVCVPPVPAVVGELGELATEDVAPEPTLAREGFGTAGGKDVADDAVLVTGGAFWEGLATLFGEEVVLDAAAGVIVPAGVTVVGVPVVVSMGDAPFADPDVLGAGTADNQSTVTFNPSMSADLEADTTVFCVDDDWLEEAAGLNRV